MTSENSRGEKASRKRRNGGLVVEDILKKWKKVNNDGVLVEEIRRVAPAKGSKKGCMRGKGGPQNSDCNFRGVRQRTWGKWVAEIRQPVSTNNNNNNKPTRLWLGTFPTALHAALAYDHAATAMYGPFDRLNFPHPSSSSAHEINGCYSMLKVEQTANTVNFSYTDANPNSFYDPNIGNRLTEGNIKEGLALHATRTLDHNHPSEICVKYEAMDTQNGFNNCNQYARSYWIPEWATGDLGPMAMEVKPTEMEIYGDCMAFDRDLSLSLHRQKQMGVGDNDCINFEFLRPDYDFGLEEERRWLDLCFHG